MLPMKAEYWEKADYMADMDGTTRSAIVSQDRVFLEHADERGKDEKI